jgi:hypothetical protein
MRPQSDSYFPVFFSKMRIGLGLAHPKLIQGGLCSSFGNGPGLFYSAFELIAK